MMKPRAVILGCIFVCFICSVEGQTVITNLLVEDTLRQGTNTVAAGSQSTALGEGSMADGDFSHAEGDTTMAIGTASHAEGTLTIAGGESSHAEGEGTEALADNSHAGGAYARVRSQDSNAFIHATGTSSNLKETISQDAAHFDRLVTLESALDDDNAVLSRLENDARYLKTSGGTMAGSIDMDEGSLSNVGGISGFGHGIDIEAGGSYGTNIWENWNADMLDGYHADSFATTQQLAQKMSVTGGLANGSYTVMYGSDMEGARAQYSVNDGSIILIGGEEPATLDSMHIKMAWDLADDNPEDPSIDLKPVSGASLRGLYNSDRWWTDGRLCATNIGKTSEFFSIISGLIKAAELLDAVYIGGPTSPVASNLIIRAGSRASPGGPGGYLILSGGSQGASAGLADYPVRITSMLEVYSGEIGREYGSSPAQGQDLYIHAQDALYGYNTATGGNLRLSGGAGGWVRGTNDTSHPGKVIIETSAHFNGPISFGGEMRTNWPTCEGADTNSVQKTGDTMTGDLDLEHDLSVDGETTLGSSSNQTNLFVSGWAHIEFIPPRGGMSMGVFTNR